MAQVLGLVGCIDPRLDVSQVRRIRQQSCEKIDHQCQSIALVPANRKQEAIEGSLGIGGPSSLRVGSP
ncbi:hypothetical protein D3C72_1902850 [compost metagenome]